MSLINKYVSVVRQLAQQVLNLLKAENKMFVANCFDALGEVMAVKMESATMSKPLIIVMINYINRRFLDVFSDAEASAVTILHPKFEMSWTDNKSMIDSRLYS